jgi:maleylpyruvate isomerase
VGCDIHPINNKRILERLRHSFGADESAINEWCATWISAGFDAFEALLPTRGNTGPFSFGETPTLADVYLVPQIESSRRFKVDLSRWPRLCEIERHCSELDAFRRAAPASQADAA